MSIDWTHFTPWSALAGGLLIGLSAALLVLLKGRVMGISGIISGLLRPQGSDWQWRLAFVVGILITPWLYQLFTQLPESRIDADWDTLIIAGLLIGYGTRLGSGCTSGHGVCGLSRLSARSLAATVTFMLLGFITVFIVRHLIA